MPTAGLPGPAGVAGTCAGWLGPVVVGVGAGPDGARGVAGVAWADSVVVLVLADPALRAGMAVVLDDGAVAPGGAGAAVVAVSAAAAVELVVVLGGPAMANSPPFRNDGGPLWVIV